MKSLGKQSIIVEVDGDSLGTPLSRTVYQKKNGEYYFNLKGNKEKVEERDGKFYHVIRSDEMVALQYP